ncbi:hypothetical protein [Nonomuraea longispora]|uniref:hypothetical protein n=1 Tax=Nonomuraea longispora TaxID=1848320 RepID=UPI00104E10A5|nr:hypothetical protein [Nonomuraea longispora]
MRREPHAVILVGGITEGGIGILGRVMDSVDLTEFVSRPYRDVAPGREVPAQESGKLIDPICGMSVDLDAPLTLVHQGTLYGFCHGLCRRAFAEGHDLSLGRQHASTDT